jgi:hypothetical protein
MAYAGTPTGLAQQAGTSRPWKTALAAIAVLAIGLALVIAVLFINSRAVAPASDRSYDQIEAHRGAAALAAGTSSSTFVSEDKPALAPALENAAAAKARGMSGVPAVGSTSANGTEGAAAAAARAGTTTVDDSYNAIEKMRAAAIRNGAPLNAWQIDQTRGAHGPLK